MEKNTYLVEFVSTEERRSRALPVDQGEYRKASSFHSRWTKWWHGLGIAFLGAAFVTLSTASAQKSSGKIMPLGDSITHGFNGINYPNGSIPGGYRKQLGARLSSAGHTYDFIGTSSANSSVGMDPHHNGFNGIRTDQVLAKLSTWLASNPDIVLMHLGTNDLIQHVPLSTLVSNLGTLIQKITTNAPRRQLYVATIIPIIDKRDGYTAAQWVSVIGAYNVEVRNLVKHYASQGRQVFLVEMNAGLVYTASSSINKFFQPGDGTHPGQAGYNQMGDMWFKAIQSKGTGTPVITIPDSLLANGSFGTGFNNWVATGNQTIASAAPYTTGSGASLVSFNGGNLPANSQTFATTAGQAHTLAFDLGVFAYIKKTQSMLVTVTGNGSILTKSITITGSGKGTSIWVPQTFVFIANSASTTLTFRDQSASTISIDMLLDNVSVTKPIANPPVSVEVTTHNQKWPALAGIPGNIIVSMSVTRGGFYFLESSTDLITWEKLDSMTVEGPGMVTFMDTRPFHTAGPATGRYYRIGNQ
jgi:lysophospholipase L1-like esterase